MRFGERQVESCSAYLVTMNIFDSPAQTLVNTVNTVGIILGKGIAAEYKKRYPEMFHRYAEFCANGMLTTGMLYLYRSPNKWVLNFPTKRHWRNPSKVEYIEEGLKKFVATWAEYGITSISFPQLGTGNGGLDWEKAVQPLMERHLKDLPLSIFIHVAKTRSDLSLSRRTRSAGSTCSNREWTSVSMSFFLIPLGTREWRGAGGEQ